MKALFLELDGVLHLGPYKQIERIVRFNDHAKAEYICADLLDKQAIKTLNELMNTVQNLWIVVFSDWDLILSLQQIRAIMDKAGFNFPYRIFSTVPRYTNVKTSRIYAWLRENAEENEVNSFCIIDSEETKNLLENYSIATIDDIGLSKSDIKIVVENFKRNEYKLDKLWHAILKDH
jgi:hypothetical protein